MPGYRALNEEFEEKLKKTARFVPAAFHIHSPESRDWPRAGSDRSLNDKAAFLAEGGERAFLDHLAAHYRIVCITDHMKSQYACRLAQAATGRAEIAVFPGMEVNCRIGGGMNERVHLLVAFPPERDVTAIDRIFAGASLAGEADRNGTEDFNLPSTLGDWVQAVEHEGGIVIAAHIDDPSRGHRAHFRAMRDASVRMFVTDLDDASTIDEQRAISEEYKTTILESGVHALEIMKPEDRQHYVRTVLPGGRQIRIPCVIRSDHHCIEDLGRADRITYVKVSRLDFACVRQAFEFHETRIKFASDLVPGPSPRIVGLRMRSPSGNALFDEVNIAFNENLNCLIGPRGCGKSTVIEAIRFVLGQNFALHGESDELGTDYRALALRIQQANLVDTIIELIYEIEGGERHYLRATFDAKTDLTTQAFTLQGDALPITQSTIDSRYPVRMYSWSEIETLGREPPLQRSLIDRFIDRLPEYDSARTSLYGALTRNRKEIEAKLQGLRDKQREDGDLLARFAEFRSDFERINEPGVSKLFEELDSARERLATAEELASELQELRDVIEGIGEIDPVGLRARLLSGKSTTTTEWWDKTLSPRVRLSDVASALATGKENTVRAIDEKRAAIQSLIEEEQVAVQTCETELREKTQVSPEVELVAGQREQTKRRFDAAKRKREEYEQLFLDYQSLMSERAKLIRQLEEAQDKISGARATSRDTLIGRLNEFDVPDLAISIVVQAGADRSKCEHFMQEEGFLRRDDFGHYKRSRFAARCCAMACPPRIARAILTRSVEVLKEEGKAFDGVGVLTSEEADNLVRAFYPFRDDEGGEVKVVDAMRLQSIFDLQEQLWDDQVRILLNEKPVDHLSPGQRSSAMLPLLAMAEQVPLVIDQPEDNLDNRMVGRTLTAILAKLKERRQIIVATHNPNIVVGGDAEQVIVLDTPESRKAVVSDSGSIDDSGIVRAVINIMEGGKEAFEARKRRYSAHLEDLDT